MAREAKARIKINKLLEESGWRFFDGPQGRAKTGDSGGKPQKKLRILLRTLGWPMGTL